MNLSAYNNVTPDTLYNEGKTSITFFYTNGKIYDKPFPTNHQDMLEDDEVFDAVYPKFMDEKDLELRKKGLKGETLEKALAKALKPYQSRGTASQHSVLGRFGIYGNDMVISFWRSVHDPDVKLALDALLKKYPQIKKAEVIVTGADAKTENPEGKPVLLSKLLNIKGAQKVIPDILQKPKDYDLKKYNIGGSLYSLKELGKLRAVTHTKRNYDPSMPSDPFAVLCHPDMQKYPELANYMPNCKGGFSTMLRATHPANWRQQGRANDLPYLYSYGEWLSDVEPKLYIPVPFSS